VKLVQGGKYQRRGERRVNTRKEKEKGPKKEKGKTLKVSPRRGTNCTTPKIQEWNTFS